MIPLSALEGIFVLDLSRILTGPFCSMMLADLGAEVVKVEQPGTGDDTRRWGPPFVEGESAYYLSINRNKRSITLNLKSEGGRRVFFDLLDRADVLLENFRPGIMEGLGFSYEELSRRNPRLIYASISGFGQTGPYAHKPGFDVIAQGMGGIMGMTGEPGRGPVKVATSIADIGAGMWACYGILAALHARQRTGRGQRIDTSLLEGQIAWLTYLAGSYFATGRDPEKLGSAHASIAPYQAVRCQDDDINIGVGTDALWRKFCDVIGRPELKDDARFATNADRVVHRAELMSILEPVFAARPARHFLDLLEAAGIPCGPIYRLNQVFSDPQVRAREMLVEIPHPKAGSVKMTGLPVKFSDTPGKITRHPPLLGEHTEEVLAELGYDAARIAALRAEGAI